MVANSFNGPGARAVQEEQPQLPVARGVPVAEAVPVGQRGVETVGTAVAFGVAADDSASTGTAAQRALRSDSFCLLLLSLPQVYTLQGLLGIFVAFTILCGRLDTRRLSHQLSVLRVCTFLIQVVCSLSVVRSAVGLIHVSSHPPEVCSNTCATAWDGECDDGGGQSLFDTCAIGTDCEDCTAREHYLEAFVFFFLLSGALNLALLLSATRVTLRVRGLRLLQVVNGVETMV